MADASLNRPELGDYSVIIQILTWFLFTTTALAYFARLATKIVIRRTVFEADDYWVTLSLGFTVVQSATVAVSAINGLGKPSYTNDRGQLVKVEKYQYASQLLWVLSLCFSRLAYLSMVKNITPVEDHRMKVRALYVAVIGWAVISLLVSAFQCPTPRVWDYLQSHCINRPAWFISLDGLNILLDVGLIALPTSLILPLQIQLSRKIQAVFFFFWIRALVIAASICDAIFWSRLRTSADQVRDIWPVVISTQTVQALSIITVSALYLKPFIQMLQSGFLRIDDMQRRGSAGASKTSRNFPSARSRTTASSGQALGLWSRIVADPSPQKDSGDESENSRTNFILAETTTTIESDHMPQYLLESNIYDLALDGQPSAGLRNASYSGYELQPIEKKALS